MPPNASSLVNAVDKKISFQSQDQQKLLIWYQFNKLAYWSNLLLFNWVFSFVSNDDICHCAKWKGHLARAACEIRKDAGILTAGMLNIELCWMLWKGKLIQQKVSFRCKLCISVSHLCCFCAMTCDPDIAFPCPQKPQRAAQRMGMVLQCRASNIEFQKWDEGHFQIPVIKQISHRDVTYNIRNMVKNMVITLFGNRWSLDLWWPLHNIGNVKALCSTPETNRMSAIFQLKEVQLSVSEPSFLTTHY